MQQEDSNAQQQPLSSVQFINLQLGRMKLSGTDSWDTGAAMQR